MTLAVSPDAAGTADPRHIEAQPVAGHIGAEILGADLSAPTAEVVAEIRAALLRWKVLFFRAQPLTQAQHVAFGRWFGDVTAAHPTLPAAFAEHPEILLLDNRQAKSRQGSSIESRWHTDVTFVLTPPMGSILRGVVVPPYGGDTQFTNLAVAYERLSAPIRDLIDGLHAVHHNVLPIARGERRDRRRHLDVCRGEATGIVCRERHVYAIRVAQVEVGMVIGRFGQRRDLLDE